MFLAGHRPAIGRPRNIFLDPPLVEDPKKKNTQIQHVIILFNQGSSIVSDRSGQISGIASLILSSLRSTSACIFCSSKVFGCVV